MDRSALGLGPKASVDGQRPKFTTALGLGFTSFVALAGEAPFVCLSARLRVILKKRVPRYGILEKRPPDPGSEFPDSVDFEICDLRYQITISRGVHNL